MTADGPERVPLRDLVAELEPGISVGGLDRPAGLNECGVLRLSAISSGQFDPTKNKAVVNVPAGARLGVNAGDLLVARASGSKDLVGACALVDRDNRRLFLPDKIWRVKLRDLTRDDPRWLFFLLQEDKFRRELRDRASGSSGMMNISQRSFLGLSVPRPPKAMQNAGADALLPLWDSIKVLRALVAAKKRFKQALMRELLTGGSRALPRPNEWAELKLGELFSERVETNRGDLPLLSITALRGVVPREQLDRRDSSSVDKSTYLRITPGDIGYNTMRMWQGVSALSHLEGIVSPAYTIVVPGPAVDGLFAATLFKFAHVVNLFRRNSQGLVDDTLSLKFHHFARIRLRFPPLEEQRAISAVFGAIDREIELLTKLSHAVQRQKHGLLDKLISGELQLARK